MLGVRGGRAVQRHFVRGDAAVDFAVGGFRLHVFRDCDGSRCGGRWCGLRPRSAAPVRDVRRRACRSGRTSRARIPAPAPPAPARRRRPRAVVEGQHHLVIPQRQRLRKALQADARRGGGIDGENARGAERVLARTFRGLRLPRRGRATVRPRRIAVAVKLRVIWPLDIFVIALGVADWVMREAITQTSSINPVKPARRGMAENIDVAQAAAQPAEAPCSTVSRCGMTRGRLRHEFVEEIARAIHAADRPHAARGGGRTA